MPGRVLSVVLLAAAAVAAVAVLAGRGGSPQPVPSPAAPPQPDPRPTTAPEPPESEQLTYVALGDSLATGAGAGTSYVEQFQQRLRSAHQARVEAVNLGRDGWTTADLLEAVRGDPRLREAVAEADVVTVDIGGNDLLQARLLAYQGRCGGADGQDCMRAAVVAFAERWEAILDEVGALSGDRADVRTMDLYHPFVAEERAAGVLEEHYPYLEAVNDHIADSAGRRGVAVAPVHRAFNGPDGRRDPVPRGLISGDGLHPSDAGHELIAELLADA